MNKTFKVRIEDTKDGEVKEFESNCLSVISVDESQEGERFPTTVFSGGYCTKRALYALLRALEKQKGIIAKRIFNGILEMESLSEEDDA